MKSEGSDPFWLQEVSQHILVPFPITVNLLCSTWVKISKHHWGLWERPVFNLETCKGACNPTAARETSGWRLCHSQDSDKARIKTDRTKVLTNLVWCWDFLRFSMLGEPKSTLLFSPRWDLCNHNLLAAMSISLYFKSFQLKYFFSHAVVSEGLVVEIVVKMKRESCPWGSRVFRRLFHSSSRRHRLKFIRRRESERRCSSWASHASFPPFVSLHEIQFTSNSRKTSFISCVFGGNGLTGRHEEQKVILRDKTWPNWLFSPCKKFFLSWNFSQEFRKFTRHGGACLQQSLYSGGSEFDTSPSYAGNSVSDKVKYKV